MTFVTTIEVFANTFGDGPSTYYVTRFCHRLPLSHD